jgi:flagellar motility protein MotE (MotC chaperone)
MTEDIDFYARKQLTLQNQIIVKLKEIDDPNQRYQFLCHLKEDYQQLNDAIASFETSQDHSKINHLFQLFDVC